MIYRIIDFKAVERTGMIYVLVHFWESRQSFEAGRPPILKNDFYMAMRDEDTHVVTEEEGSETYVTTESGKRRRMSPRLAEDPEDPFVRGTMKRDVPTQMRKNIEAYWERAGGVKGDRTWPVKTRPKLVDTDPAGILDRMDVKALKGQDFEALDVHA